MSGRDLCLCCLHGIDARASVRREVCCKCGGSTRARAAVVVASSFGASISHAIYKRADKAVPMGCLAVTIPCFPHVMLQSLLKSLARPADSDRRQVADWDEQPVSQFLVVDKRSGPLHRRDYNLHTWGAVSALCSFEGLHALNSKKQEPLAMENFRVVGCAGDLVVVLPPVTLKHR